MSLKGYKEMPIGGLIEEPATSKRFKTGDWRSLRPVFDKTRCIQCMFCVVWCPDFCIPTKLNNKGEPERLETELDYCKGCGICEQVCPVKCIKMEAEAKFAK